MFRSLVIIILNFKNYEIYKKANENIKIKRMSKQKYSIIRMWTLEECKISSFKKCIIIYKIYTVVSTKVFFLN